MTEIATKGDVQYDATPAVAMTEAAQGWVSTAQDYVIDSADMLDLAGGDLRQIKTLQKEVEAKRVTITGPLNAALKSVNDLFRPPREYLEQAEATLKRSMLVYTAEQERLASEARRLAAEQARQERERLEAEAREQAERARQAADAGDIEAVEVAVAAVQEAELLSAVVTVAPAIEAPARVSGISGRVTWRAEVDDLLALARAVVEGRAPIEAIAANDKFLSAQAKAFKRAGELYPGVRAVGERDIAARAA